MMPAVGPCTRPTRLATATDRRLMTQQVTATGVQRPARNAAAAALLVVILLRKPLELLEQDYILMRRDVEPAPARTTDHIAIDPHEVVLDLVEHGSRPGVGAGRHLGFLRPANPPDGV